MPTLRPLAAFAVVALSGAFAVQAPIARAAAADPAATRIEAFDRTLIDTMKSGPALDSQCRYRKLEPG
ncbi:MAG: hypothetical protein ACR2FH_11225, partial [Caulobacteraceae bacterium]